MRIEFDHEKNEANKRKHGLDLADFQGWDGEALTVEDDRYDYGETRWSDLGRIGGQLYALVYTVIEPAAGDEEETWRLISWRKASEREIGYYDRD
jgi:uncharacterized DUF497 family protein